MRTIAATLNKYIQPHDPYLLNKFDNFKQKSK